MDRIYTPPELAGKMVKKTHAKSQTYIADFAAGDGELLKAARNRWPSSRIIATDINTSSVSLLRRTEPTWQIGQCDFLNSISRARCQALDDLLGKVTLILLNPPFTCRGSTYWSVEIGGEVVRCGLALAFVLTSLRYLAPKGQVVAVLPSGCLHSQRDITAWGLIKQLCRVKVIKENGHRTFSGWSPRTVVVRLRLRSLTRKTQRKSSPLREVKPIRNGIAITIIRGTTSMNTINGQPLGNARPLIHSTELRQEGLNLSRRMADSKLRSVSGPAVLLPRVGRPNKTKVLLYNQRRYVVLSDCVFALKCDTASDAVLIRSRLLQHWKTVESCYVGTCARYITIKALSEILRNLGFNVKTNGEST